MRKAIEQPEEQKESRYEMIKRIAEEKMKSLFLPGELEDEQPIRFDD